MHHYLLICVLCLLARASFAETASAAPKKVAIVDGINFTTQGLRTTVREADHFYKVLVQSLTDGGWSPMSPPISQRLCVGAGAGDCLAYIARESAAAYVLRLTGDGNLRDGYALNIEVYSPRTKHYQRSKHICDVCLTDDISRSTAELGLALLADASKDDAEAERESAQRATPAKGITGQNLASVPVTNEPRRLSLIPWSMVGVGLVGVALGSWWLYEDGRSQGFRATSPVITNDYASSKSLGVASLVGGIAVLAGGVIWLAVTPSSTVSVSASSNHVALGLRY